jgi:capsule polysaccharide export protein KpsE/RkpR
VLSRILERKIEPPQQLAGVAAQYPQRLSTETLKTILGSLIVFGVGLSIVSIKALGMKYG